MRAVVVCGDARVELSQLPAESFDGLLCDPPYGIDLMRVGWDSGVPPVSVWREVLRVLKPGAFGFVACGTRTQHRMIVNVEDAGFEVRDVLAWVHASGFPKGSNVSRALDKRAGAVRRVVSARKGRTGKAGRAEGVYITPGFAWPGEYEVTEPATANAWRWDGYDTVLRPSMELWTLVRKPPVSGPLARNVEAHDVGGLNIKGGMIPGEDRSRWPGNVTHDGSSVVTELFPNGASKFFYCAKAGKEEREFAGGHPSVKPQALLRHLATLLLPPNDVERRLLVPFCGSGSEMIAGLSVGWAFAWGAEIVEEYAIAARERLAKAALS